MRYALFICEDESAEISAQERWRRAEALAAFQDELAGRGVLLGRERLQPAVTATTVRAWDGGDVMIDGGPFAQTREQIVGCCMVDCKDLDEAIEVALKMPAGPRLDLTRLGGVMGPPFVAALVRLSDVHHLDGQVASLAEHLVRHAGPVQQA